MCSVASQWPVRGERSLGEAGGRKHDCSHATPASSSVGNIQGRWLRSKSQAGDLQDCTGQKESLSPVPLCEQAP